MFMCEICGIQFSRNDNLLQHVTNQHSTEKSECSICNETFTNKRRLSYHVKKHAIPTKKIKTATNTSNVDVPRSCDVNVNDVARSSMGNDDTVVCSICKVSVISKKLSTHYRTLEHKNNCLRKYSEDKNIEIVGSAFKSRIISYRISDLDKEYINIDDFMNSIKEKIFVLLKEQINIQKAAKINFDLFALYTKQSLKEDESDVENTIKATSIKSFNTKNKIITEAIDFDELFSDILETLNKQSEDFQEKDSGWALENILFIEMNINKYNPLRASSYIKLPKIINDKKAIINIRNRDQACFAWSIMAALYPTDNNHDRCSSYPNYNDKLNLNGISMPVGIKDIPKFENLNPNISVNVFGLENGQIVGPLYFSKNKKSDHVNLLLIENDDDKHYCLINNLSRLVSSQISGHEHKLHICDGCLTFFRDETKLNYHLANGCNNIRCILPNEENNITKFKNFHHKERVPFSIFCDFEAILKPIDTCTSNPEKSFTTNIQEHSPCSFAYYIKCAHDDSLSKFVTYRGEDCGSVFISRITEDLKKINKILKTEIPMKTLSKDENRKYYNDKECHVCGGAFTDSNYKVRDHCHLTGQFRGAAHTKCNLNYKIKSFVPMFCHNLSGYDSHFIVKQLGFDTEKIDVLAQNKERYISFSKYFKFGENDGIKLRFLDSFKFMPSSIDSLCKNLSDDQFSETEKFFTNPEELKLVKQKGVFPYDYLDSFQKFNDTSLPPRDKFHNKLTKSDISDTDFIHANSIWKVFKCNTLGEYSDIYLKSDVLILADIFENFRNTCMKTYSLDPAHYYTAPGLSWDAMLKYTKVELELLTNIDMVHFIQKGIRGGLAQCSKRYSKANNKYLPNFDNKSISSYITYLDANNLYGWAMSQFLPYADFRWLEQTEIDSFDIDTIQDDESETGLIFEADLEYPQSLHDRHKDLPYCFENLRPPGSKTNKLIANLMNKKKYIIHQKNLKQCVLDGLKISKIHRVLQFSQKAWLKPYIDLNTDLRKKALNSFDKDFYKLMNNSVFGKTMENVEKRTDIRLVTHWGNIAQKLGANSLISRSNFKSCVKFSDNLVAIELSRLKVEYNKPIYVGFCVLEISKTLMFDFHYRHMLPQYGDNITLLYTDTDSFVYEIKTDDFYADIKTSLDKFDTSDFPTDNKYGIPLANKKVLGKFKDEMCGTLITEFIGIKAKSYCIITETDEIKKIKGIKKNVVRNEISSNDFKSCIFHNKNILRNQLIIRSHKHNLYTQILNKLCLNNTDDKRFIIPKTYETLPWGHKQIDEYDTLI